MIIVDYSGIALASIIINKTFDEQLIRHMILNSLRMYRTRYKEEYGELVLAVDASNNWRKTAFPQYKASRKKTQKESTFDWGEAFRILNKIREEIAENFPYTVVRVDGCEADDVIGFLATYDNGEERIVVSEDKDLLTIPGMHWDIKNQTLWEQDKDTADYLFYKQALTGDSVDNYQGCPGIGPKKAEKILNECEDFGFEPKHVWKAIVTAYENAGLNEDDAVLQARMARILRHGEYVMSEPLYWSPENER